MKAHALWEYSHPTVYFSNNVYTQLQRVIAAGFIENGFLYNEGEQSG